MFTGLVDDIGVVDSVRSTAAGVELRVKCAYPDLADGESIALNGVCLTVREHANEGPVHWFTCAAMEATRARSTVGAWRAGRRVNLERALRAGDRLGGHIVQGHVDVVGRVLAVRESDDALFIDIHVGGELDDLLIPHGSITVDGVSLTINDLPASAVAQVAIIEYTRRHTTLGDLREGDEVNIEGDVIGKYVRRLLASRTL